MPRYFYKYKSLDKKCDEDEKCAECKGDKKCNKYYTIKILKDQKIYFPKFGELNDPHDGKIYFDRNITKKEFIKFYNGLKTIGPIQCDLKSFFNAKGRLIRDRVDNFYDNNMEHTSTMIPGLGVLCLSETCTNPLMWAHYSNNSGICIEFDGLDSLLQDEEINWEIKYSKQYPIIKITDYLPENLSVVKKSYGTKYLDWKYEREWRLINEEGGKEWELPAKISSIIFGLKTTNEDIEEIGNMALNTQIKLRRLVLSRTKYEYEIEDYKSVK